MEGHFNPELTTLMFENFSECVATEIELEPEINPEKENTLNIKVFRKNTKVRNLEVDCLKIAVCKSLLGLE